MTNQIKVAYIGAGAVIVAALIAGFFTLYSSSGVQQTTECGAVIANTNGSVTINDKNDCDKVKP